MDLHVHYYLIIFVHSYNVGKKIRDMKSKFIFSIVLSLTLSGCEELINSAIDCSINGLKLENKSLRIGAAGRNYYETISANVKNDPADDYYIYDFIVRGELQKGLQYFTEGNELVINGVPEEAGTIGFELTVEVTVDDEGLGVCTKKTKKTYELIVK